MLPLHDGSSPYVATNGNQMNSDTNVGSQSAKCKTSKTCNLIISWKVDAPLPVMRSRKCISYLKIYPSDR